MARFVLTVESAMRYTTALSITSSTPRCIRRVRRLGSSYQRRAEPVSRAALREDVACFAKLGDLAQSVKDLEAFKRAARRIGWTQSDTRTNELAEPLDALLEAVFACQTATTDVGQETRLRDAWLELHRVRDGAARRLPVYPGATPGQLIA
jgi:hypothetical protein